MTMMRKSFDYDALVEGLRKVPTFDIAEEVARKDFKVKLPERRWLTILNSPEISQFRGIQEEMDASAMERNRVDRDKNAINKAAHDADASTPDMTFVQEAVNQQRSMASSFASHLSDMARAHAQRMAGQDLETKAELERLASLQSESEKKARMAEMALGTFRDIQDEDRLRLGRMLERAGVVHNHIDQSSVVNNTTMLDTTNQHNQVLNLVNAHGHNFGQFMAQQNMNQVEMMRLLNEHVRRNPAPVIHLMPPSGETPMDLEVFTGGGPPPPPPPSGSVKVKKPTTTKKRDPRAIIVNRPGDSQQPPPAPPPTPIAVPIPTVPTAAADVAMFDIGTPRAKAGKGRGRSRSATRTEARPKVAWMRGMIEDEARIPMSDPTSPPLPPPIIAAPNGPRAISVPRGRKRNESLETIRYPSGEPPQVKPKTAPRAKAQAKAAPRTSSASTVRYPSEPPVMTSSSSGGPPPPPPPAARAKAKAKAAPRTIFRSPSSASPAAPAEVFLPTTENAAKTAAALPKVIKGALKAGTGKAEGKARGRPRKTPESGASAVKKNVAKYVRLPGGKPLGRPKGAFGKARRDAMERKSLEESSMA